MDSPSSTLIMSTVKWLQTGSQWNIHTHLNYSFLLQWETWHSSEKIHVIYIFMFLKLMYIFSSGKNTVRNIGLTSDSEIREGDMLKKPNGNLSV